MSIISRANLTTVAVCAALIVAAGAGGAVAGAQITGAQIKDGTITTADIRNGSVTGLDVRDGAIKSADIRDGSVTGLDVRDGSLGTEDLSASARNGFLDRGVSGSVDSNGVLTVRSKTAGSTVAVQKDVGATGWWCITVTGGSRPLNPTTATLVATPDYRNDSTNTQDSWNAVVESATGNYDYCQGGFRVTTLLRVPESQGALIRSNEAFVFQIN